MRTLKKYLRGCMKPVKMVVSLGSVVANPSQVRAKGST